MIEPRSELDLSQEPVGPERRREIRMKNFQRDSAIVLADPARDRLSPFRRCPARGRLYTSATANREDAERSGEVCIRWRLLMALISRIVAKRLRDRDRCRSIRGDRIPCPLRARDIEIASSILPSDEYVQATLYRQHRIFRIDRERPLGVLDRRLRFAEAGEHAAPQDWRRWRRRDSAPGFSPSAEDRDEASAFLVSACRASLYAWPRKCARLIVLGPKR